MINLANVSIKTEQVKYFEAKHFWQGYDCTKKCWKFFNFYGIAKVFEHFNSKSPKLTTDISVESATLICSAGENPTAGWANCPQKSLLQSHKVTGQHVDWSPCCAYHRDANIRQIQVPILDKMLNYNDRMGVICYDCQIRHFVYCTHFRYYSEKIMTLLDFSHDSFLEKIQVDLSRPIFICSSFILSYPVTQLKEQQQQ